MSLLYWRGSPKQAQADLLSSIHESEDHFDTVSSSEGNASNHSFDITLSKRIGSSSKKKPKVFLARWRVHQESTVTPTPTLCKPDDCEQVVCKVGYSQGQVDSVVHEYRLYTKLRALQGSSVPIVHGLFGGETSKRGNITVLVMEHCGEAVENLKRSADEIRLAAFFALVSIHKHGVSHGDFAGRNVVQSTAEDGSVSVKLVDFERGKEHVCAFDFDQKIELYDKEPIRPPCKCYEIYTAGQEAAIWRPGIYVVCGALVVPEWVENHTADELFMMILNDKTVRSKIPSDCTDADVRREAEGAIEDWEKWVAEKNKRDAKFRVV